MTGLTRLDKHYWTPTPQVVAWLRERIAPDAKVLEIGPGYVPFPRADAFVDFVDRTIAQGPVHKVDVADGVLPFPDKSFDFIYCRHVLEDLYDPFHLCAEMSRVAKAGYIETPSPIAELCRGIDGDAPPYRGYHHHRFMIWKNRDELRFVSKYPLIEYLTFDDGYLAKLLLAGPKYWNTYHLWEDAINVQHRQSPLHFDIPRDYTMLLGDAVKNAVASADEFWMQIPQRAEVSQLLPRVGLSAA